MRHYHLDEEKSAHYAVNTNHSNDKVLVQLSDDEGTQVRLGLDVKQALHLIELLRLSVEDIIDTKLYK